MTLPGLSAPIFKFGEGRHLPIDDTNLRDGMTGISFAMTGPGVTAEAGHLPVRGDLAHISLAGRYFVPHYAVPMPHVVGSGGCAIRSAAKLEATLVCELPANAIFDVLDISGGWAWGQCGADGFVGYVPMAGLKAAGT